MPVTTTSERDVTVQVTGQYRGVIVCTFADARILELNRRAPNQAAWDALKAGADTEAEAIMARQDAQAMVDPDQDVAASGEASQADTCIAYIRAAWGEQFATDAYALYVRINNYVTNNGGWAAAKPALLTAGLSDEEYTQAETAWNYLSNGTRPAEMAAGQVIQGAWEGQH